MSCCVCEAIAVVRSALWDGDGDGEELIESEAIAIYQDGEEYIVDFEILESAEDILQTRVKVTGIN